MNQCASSELRGGGTRCCVLQNAQTLTRERGSNYVVIGTELVQHPSFTQGLALLEAASLVTLLKRLGYNAYLRIERFDKLFRIYILRPLCINLRAYFCII